MADPVLEPLTIKKLTLRNRVVSTSHAPGYAENGRPKARYQLYHEEKARGGIGMTMFGGSSNIAPDSASVFGGSSNASLDVSKCDNGAHFTQHGRHDLFAIGCREVIQFIDPRLLPTPRFEHGLDMILRMHIDEVALID